MDDDEQVHRHSHHITATWQPSYELGTFLFSGDDGESLRRPEIDRTGLQFEPISRTPAARKIESFAQKIVDALSRIRR